MAATPCVLLVGKTWHLPILIFGMHRFLASQQSTHFDEVWLIEGCSQGTDMAGEERWELCISVQLHPHKDWAQGQHSGWERCQEQSQGASKSQEHPVSAGWCIFILPMLWLPLESLLHSLPDSGHMEIWHLLAAIILPQMWLWILEPHLDFLSQELNLNSVFLWEKNNLPGAVIFSHMIERCWWDGFPHGKEVAMLLKRPICHGIYLWHKNSLETNTAFCGEPVRNKSLLFWQRKQKRREIEYFCQGYLSSKIQDGFSFFISALNSSDMKIYGF